MVREGLRLKFGVKNVRKCKGAQWSVQKLKRKFYMYPVKRDNLGKPHFQELKDTKPYLPYSHSIMIGLMSLVFHSLWV